MPSFGQRATCLGFGSATGRYPLNGGEASPVIKHLTVECLELNIKCHILSTFQRSVKVLLLFLTSVQRD